MNQSRTRIRLILFIYSKMRVDKLTVHKFLHWKTNKRVLDYLFQLNIDPSIDPLTFGPFKKNRVLSSSVNWWRSWGNYPNYHQFQLFFSTRKTYTYLSSLCKLSTQTLLFRLGSLSYFISKRTSKQQWKFNVLFLKIFINWLMTKNLIL